MYMYFNIVLTFTIIHVYLFRLIHIVDWLPTLASIAGFDIG